MDLHATKIFMFVVLFLFCKKYEIFADIEWNCEKGINTLHPS